MQEGDRAELLRRFGQVVGDRLKEKDLSQRALSEACDKSNSTIASWVNGERAITIDNLIDLAKALGIPASVLIAAAVGESISIYDPLEFIKQASPADAPKISEIVTEGIRWLVAHGYGPKSQPQSIAAFRDELLTHTQAIATATETPPERIKAIAQGDWPTNKEIMALASYWGPDNEWLTSLIRVAKGESGTGSTIDRRAKSKQRQLPSGKD